MAQPEEKPQGVLSKPVAHMSIHTGWAAFFCNLPVNWTTSGLKQRKRTLNKELVVGSFRICSAGQPSELEIL